MRALTAPDKQAANVAYGIIALSFQSGGESWATALLARAAGEKWGDEAVYRILSSLPQSMWTWKQAEAFGQKIDDLYWTRVYCHWVNDKDELIFAIEKLLGALRATHAIMLIARARNQELPRELLLRTLSQAASEPWTGSENITMLRHSVVEIFKNLDDAGDIPDDVMARLEWGFLPLFRHSGRRPLALQRALSSSPEFFVEALSAVYRPSKESGVEEAPPADPERASAIATQAYELLRGWRRVPGSSDDGVIDPVALEEWVKETRILCARVGRQAVGDIHIGQILAAAPSEPDGVWPAIAVRELIEITRSREVERGVLTGVHNGKGASWRDMKAGGAPERALANHYRRCAAETALEWPRTAALLERIAKSYEQQGQWHDDDTERMDWQ